MAVIWAEHWAETLARVDVIRKLALAVAAGSMADDTLSPQRAQARFEAHALAGSCAIFGRHEGSRIALEIEARLDEPGPLSGEDGERLVTLVDALRHALDTES
ncbi:MAG: Hpt domain-containing protein [Chloroflexi bacterium]|nr:Hpt domain-containing protein [Chloroflexota bacterium]